MDQTACKPGSVTRPKTRDDHSSGPAIADRFSRPTRTPRAGDGPAPCGARNPYSVLLQAGLAMPSLSPGPRWALTPPFHPFRRRSGGGLLSVALSLGSPRAGVTRRLVAVEPGLSSTPEGTAIARPSDPGRYVRAGARKVNASFATLARELAPQDDENRWASTKLVMVRSRLLGRRREPRKAPTPPPAAPPSASPASGRRLHRPSGSGPSGAGRR